VSVAATTRVKPGQFQLVQKEQLQPWFSLDVLDVVTQEERSAKMTENKIVLLTSENTSLRVIKPQPTYSSFPKKELTEKEAIKAKLECPRCYWIFEVPPPDNKHPNSTYNKQEASNTLSSIIEEKRVCRNPKCKKPFTIYWHKRAAVASKTA
jgi:hypothetical protein